MSGFDQKKDLWIQIDLTNIPEDMKYLTGLAATAVPDPTMPGAYKGVVEFNLTEYIRKIVGEVA